MERLGRKIGWVYFFLFVRPKVAVGETENSNHDLNIEDRAGSDVARALPSLGFITMTFDLAGGFGQVRQTPGDRSPVNQTLKGTGSEVQQPQRAPCREPCVPGFRLPSSFPCVAGRSSSTAAGSETASEDVEIN
ncbi:hypothetical protein ElyMa_004515500 [Elysia marginata]|uniref:Reverse transcriptase domain-containing protein n=1 Tax=Elysia marginata TaxID=1093978 RepID=A0AAV4HNN8_9GAST|nr:hypothetical protein ElyMa_004515500 [Elysia marginata]